MKAKLLFFLALLYIGAMAQPKIRVDFNSDITGKTLSGIAITPKATYYPTDKLGIGAGLIIHGGDYDSHIIDLSARYYLCNNWYAQVGTTLASDNNTKGNLILGYTFWMKRFYMEPHLHGIYYNNNYDVNFGLGVGIQLE